MLWVRLGSEESLHKLSKGLGFEEFSLKKVSDYIFIFVEVKFRFTCSVIYFFSSLSQCLMIIFVWFY